MTDELKPLATVEDTEIYLRHKVPIDLVDYEERKRGAASNVLRMMYRNQGDDLDKQVTEDQLTRQMVADIIGVSVAQDVSRKESMSDSDTDLSAFKTFTQTAATVLPANGEATRTTCSSPATNSNSWASDAPP